MIQGRSVILKLVRERKFVEPVDKNSVGEVSVDLKLGRVLKMYTKRLDLRVGAKAKKREISNSGMWLEPGDFVIGCTLEKVSIPAGYWGFLETKGNIARAGISVHNSDGHIDPGYRGVVTLEIKNQNTVPVKIYPEMKIAQLFLFGIKGKAGIYSGKYQDSLEPTIFVPDGIAE